MLNSYLSLEKDPAAAAWHPLLRGFEDAGRIINAVNQVDVTSTDANQFTPLRIVPSYPDLPMESVFTPPRRHAFSRRLLAAAWATAASFISPAIWTAPSGRCSAVDHGKLLAQCSGVGNQRAPPVKVEGPGILDVAVWEQKASMTLHLVNLTNPMMWRGPVREIIPISGQKISLRIPSGRRIRRVHLLVAARDVPYRAEGDTIHLETPSIGLHEVVAVDFSA